MDEAQRLNRCKFLTLVQAKGRLRPNLPIYCGQVSYKAAPYALIDTIKNLIQDKDLNSSA